MCIRDRSPLWAAYPQLEHLLIRGSDGLALPALRLARLRTLRIECGGLDRAVVHQVLAADLPALEELTLYLGDDDYGATSTVEDLGPLLRGEVPVSYTHLDVYKRQREHPHRRVESADQAGYAAAAAGAAARGHPDRARDQRGDQRAALQPPALRRLQRVRAQGRPARQRPQGRPRPVPAHRPGHRRQLDADPGLRHGRTGLGRAQGRRDGCRPQLCLLYTSRGV